MSNVDREALPHGTEPSSNEVDLLERIVDEDIGAFEALYRNYRPRLTRFIGGMTRQPALTEEVLDDTMMVVWRKAHTYNRVAKVSTWIFAVAYRQTLKALRRNRHPEAFDEGRGEEAASESGPDTELQQHELRAHLDRALADLSPEQRAVIELTYYLGYSCREIAHIMGCPVDTVKTRMFYARRKLKARISLAREEAL